MDIPGPFSTSPQTGPGEGGYSVVDKAEDKRQEEERHKNEAVKSRFEYLKHLTTLAGATAAVEVAIFQTETLRNERLDGLVMVVSLVFLAVAIAIALVRMILLLDMDSLPSTSPEYACTIMVLGGVGFFMVRAISWSVPQSFTTAVLYFGAPVLIVVLTAASYRFLYHN
jgi:hypothetical protein